MKVRSVAWSSLPGSAREIDRLSGFTDMFLVLQRNETPAGFDCAESFANLGKATISFVMSVRLRISL
jgi:hypothetical protein